MKTFALLTLLASTALASAQTNLIVNGDFESDSYPNGTPIELTQTGTTLTGWQILGEVAGIGVGYNGNATQELDLSGFSDGVGTGISTQFATTVGRSYILDFNIEGGFASVAINGAIVGNQINGTRSELHSYTFTATNTVSSLEFLAVGGSVSQLDNVSVTASPVPEPASLCALGLGGLALLRRRKSRASS